MGHVKTKMILIAVPFLIGLTAAAADESWLQFKYDCRHSGNVPDRSVITPLGLTGAVPLTDAIFTAPVVADGRIYVVDGAGVAFCIDAATLRIIWKFPTRGGKTNCNNISSPAIAVLGTPYGGRYLHFGTMAGSYYVLDAANGQAHMIDTSKGNKLVSSGPCVDVRECVGAVVSNGRIFYTSQGSGLQVSQVCAGDAQTQ